MRSARAALLVASLALVLVPLVAMVVAWTYEVLLVSGYEDRLAGIADRVLAQWPCDEAKLTQVAAANGVLMRVVADEQVDVEVSPGRAGEESPWVRGPFEWLEDWFSAADSPRESLSRAEQTFGPVEEREEVVAARGGTRSFQVHLSPSGETAAMVLASRLPDGRVLTVTKATHRGVRRLLSLRRVMMRIALYQAGAALVVGLLLGRWLVQPLSRLAQRASRFPGEPLATPDLLKRRDEIGQLARAMVGLADTLERRRRDAVDRAADVAHEFKNPLATIVAAAEHLGSTSELSAEKRRLLSEVSAGAAQRLLAATEALLALAKLEASLPEQPREQVNYRAFLERILRGYREDVRWQDFEFLLRVAPEVGEVSIVPSAWQQLITNLLDNALVQPASQKCVEIDVQRQGEAVVTSVRDSGPGVSAGNRQRIFQRFFSLRPEGAPPGTGLGLSIVSAVAEAHGATVTLAPSASGAGATFLITLPSTLGRGESTATALPHDIR